MYLSYGSVHIFCTDSVHIFDTDSDHILDSDYILDSDSVISICSAGAVGCTCPVGLTKAQINNFFRVIAFYFFLHAYVFTPQDLALLKYVL